MSRFRKIIGTFRNFYVFTGTLALLWMFFFDRYNVISQIKQYRKVSALEQELEYCRTEKAKIAEMGVLDENNLEEIERFVRDNYWMKADDEDLFVIVEE